METSLTVGGRYTEDDKSDDRTTRTYLLTAPFSVDPTAKFRRFDPAVTLGYTPRNGILAYASYRTGFKSGGFQGLYTATPALANTPFLPEVVKSYEFGLKTTFLDRRLLANIALFRSDINNQQVTRSTGPGVSIIDNAGQTRDDGIDLELIAKPIPALTFSANMTIQHARFRNYISAGVSYAGNAQLRSPDYSGNFAVEYDLPLGSAGELDLRGEYAYKSKQYFNQADSMLPGQYQPDYGVGNIRVAYRPSTLPLELAGFVRNVGDTHYYINVAVAVASGVAVNGDPRTYGFSLAYHFR